MCKPVTFTCWSDNEHMLVNEYFDCNIVISFWEDQSKSAYVYLEDLSSGESKIIPMMKNADLNNGTVLTLNADVSKIGQSDIKSIFISVNKTSKVKVGDISSLASINMDIVFDDFEWNSKEFFIEKTNAPCGVPSENWSKLRNKKRIDSFNSMIDYINSIIDPSYKGFYKVNKTTNQQSN